MASCTTQQWVSTAPQARLVVGGTDASTDTTAVLAWTLYYIASYPADASARSYSVTVAGKTFTGSYNIDGKTGTLEVASGTVEVARGTTAKTVAFSVSFGFNLTWSGVYGGTKSANGSLSVAAKTSYAVTYDANGGSGAPSAQTKWHGTALTLSTAKPSRTGYTFQGWATSASGAVAYAAGASYTANAAVTLYAVWKANTYAVTYDANGGTGAPSAQTKTYGTALTLTTATPTRENYNFLGWGTSASATTATYAAGASYTANAAITLYAVWELAYTKPRIIDFDVMRSDANDNYDEDGTYASVYFEWATDYAVSSITISWVCKITGETGSHTVSATGTSGYVLEVVGDGSIDPDASYIFSAVVADAVGSSTVSATVTGNKYLIDTNGPNDSVAIGKAAQRANALEVAKTMYDKHDTVVTNGLAVYTGSGDAAVDPDTTLEHLVLTNKNTPTTGFHYVETNFYSDKGTDNNRMQVAYPYNADGAIYHRFYSGGVWSDWKKPLYNGENITALRVDTPRLELSGDVPYIDFHYGNSTEDYTHRIFTDSGILRLVDNYGGGINLQSTAAIRLYGQGTSTCIAVLSDRMRATANDTYYLGDSNYKFKAVYAVNGTIQTSDRNMKTSIEDIDERYIALFDKLHPVSFMFNDPDSDRVHIGFIAQDVKAAMDEVGLTDLEFAGFCRDKKIEYDENDTAHEVFDEDGNPVLLYSLRYSEFIALNSKMIQLNRQKLANQQAEIDTLKSEVEELKQAVARLTSDT